MERYFGGIQAGWGVREKENPAIQVVEFRRGHVPGVTVISTLGLSSFPMGTAVSGKNIRQELFLMVKDGQLDPRLPAVLDQVARECLTAGKPVLRGEMIQKQGHLLPKTDFVALYATLPIYYPNDFWTFHETDDIDVVFAWLLPLRAAEQSYVQQHGWSAFEDLLNKAAFDLFDLDRPALL